MIDIKKVFDNFKVEGFTLHPAIDPEYPELSCYVLTHSGDKYKGATCFYINSDKIVKCYYFDSLVWPGLLQRVIESINVKYDDMQIVTFYDGSGWWCFDCGDDTYRLPETTYDTPDQAKEQAINYILCKI